MEVVDLKKSPESPKQAKPFTLKQLKLVVKKEASKGDMKMESLQPVAEGAASFKRTFWTSEEEDNLIEYYTEAFREDKDTPADNSSTWWKATEEGAALFMANRGYNRTASACRQHYEIILQRQAKENKLLAKGALRALGQDEFDQTPAERRSARQIPAKAENADEEVSRTIKNWSQEEQAVLVELVNLQGDGPHDRKDFWKRISEQLAGQLYERSAPAIESYWLRSGRPKINFFGSRPRRLVQKDIGLDDAGRDLNFGTPGGEMEALQSLYMMNPTPSDNSIKGLAAKIGYTFERTKAWFVNQRTRQEHVDQNQPAAQQESGDDSPLPSRKKQRVETRKPITRRLKRKFPGGGGMMQASLPRQNEVAAFPYASGFSGPGGARNTGPLTFSGSQSQLSQSVSFAHAHNGNTTESNRVVANAFPQVSAAQIGHASTPRGPGVVNTAPVATPPSAIVPAATPVSAQSSAIRSDLAPHLRRHITEFENTIKQLTAERETHQHGLRGTQMRLESTEREISDLNRQYEDGLKRLQEIQANLQAKEEVRTFLNNEIDEREERLSQLDKELAKKQESKAVLEGPLSYEF